VPEGISTTAESSPTPTKEKSFDWLKVILAIIIGLILLSASFYAGYWYGTQSEKSQLKSQNGPTAQSMPPSPAPTTPTTTEPTDEVDETAGWQTFTSDAYGFSIRYPTDFS